MYRKEGERVGAICGRDEENKTVWFFGYGVYMNESIPTDHVFGPFGPASQLGMSSPRIRLDSGDDVWGCECWFSSQETVAKMLEAAKDQGYEVKEITPSKYRDECQAYHDMFENDGLITPVQVPCQNDPPAMR
jgi:hypothetical protein